MKVNLKEIAEGFELVNEDTRVYYDFTKNQVEVIFEDDIENDYEELEELIPENALFLPTQYEIDEYRMMEDFIDTLDGEIQHTLLFAIKGRGAFRNFKYHIHQFGMQEKWYTFKEYAFLQLAKEWCKDNNLEYEV